MNYYPRHLGDYAKDTGHLTMMEHGAYSLLLDRYYSTEEGIAQDQAHRICRARTPPEKQAVDVVLSEFFSLVSGKWTNRRAEEEIAKMREQAEKSRDNGKLGGRPKKEPRTNPDVTQQKPSGLFLGSENPPKQNPDVTQTEPRNNLSQEPKAIHQEPNLKTLSLGERGAMAEPGPTAFASGPPNRARETHPPIALAPRGSPAKRAPLVDRRPPALGKEAPPPPGTVEKNFSKSGTLAETALAEIVGAARRGGS